MTIKLFGLNFLYSLLATVIGGSILTFFFFWLKEKVFPIPKIEGRWFFEMETINTAYYPFKGMKLRYISMIWQSNNYIKGTVEKIYENSSTGKRSFVGKNRTRGKIDGYIEKNYFSKDRLILHIVEEGHGRESTHFYDLVIDSKDKMTGKFSSMVANQDGKVNWHRNEF